MVKSLQSESPDDPQREDVSDEEEEEEEGFELGDDEDEVNIDEDDDEVEIDVAGDAGEDEELVIDESGSQVPAPQLMHMYFSFMPYDVHSASDIRVSSYKSH